MPATSHVLIQYGLLCILKGCHTLAPVSKTGGAWTSNPLHPEGRHIPHSMKPLANQPALDLLLVLVGGKGQLSRIVGLKTPFAYGVSDDGVIISWQP